MCGQSDEARSNRGSAADGLYEHTETFVEVWWHANGWEAGTVCSQRSCDSIMGRSPTYFCWCCYATNLRSSGPCTFCGQAIEAPVEASYEDRLIWALEHPLPGRQMIAAQVLGELREPAAEPPLRALVHAADPFLAAQALRSLVSIVGVDGVRDLLEPLAASGAPAVSRVALRALQGSG